MCALGAARLVSTPSHRPFGGALSSGLPITGFPEFGQFRTFGFPEGTQSFKSSSVNIPLSLLFFFRCKIQCANFCAKNSKILALKSLQNSLVFRVPPAKDFHSDFPAIVNSSA
jgi:hypothetical protein